MDIVDFKKINDTLTKTETQIEAVQRVLKQKGKDLNLYNKDINNYSITTSFYLPRKYLETYLKDLEEIKVTILKQIGELSGNQREGGNND